MAHPARCVSGKKEVNEIQYNKIVDDVNPGKGALSEEKSLT
jgi:hypothetical protein